MISPKWAVLVAAFAIVGVIGLPTTAFAQDRGDDESQESEVEIERNNQISQSIEQSQEACTNEAEAEIDDDDFVDLFGENEIEQNQANVCEVTQEQNAANVASIEDNSENTFDITSILARLNLRF